MKRITTILVSGLLAFGAGNAIAQDDGAASMATISRLLDS